MLASMGKPSTVQPLSTTSVPIKRRPRNARMVFDAKAAQVIEVIGRAGSMAYPWLIPLL
jgi:hypothetical protein